jgi:hypothetical protein
MEIISGMGSSSRIKDKVSTVITIRIKMVMSM